MVCQLLGSQNVTDVMEAIEFFVTSFEFGVGNAMMGIRRMLVLIWSKEGNIKDAVVAAYKRLYLNPQGNNPRYRVHPCTRRTEIEYQNWGASCEFSFDSIGPKEPKIDLSILR